MTERQQGISYAALTYIIWGGFPLFWVFLGHVGNLEILAGRIIWSCVFTTIFILLIGKIKVLAEDLVQLWKEKKQFFSLMAASFIISLNWYVYIWAVNHDRVLETSMGYYINPIISVLFGTVFFQEKLTKMTWLAVAVAMTGVLVMTINYGQVPIVSLLLALTFAIYGVLKKRIRLEATRGLAIETLFIMPLALIFYVYLYIQGDMQFLHVDWQTDVLMMVSGILTAVPLILFAKGAQLIPLYLLGFIQYLSPTISFSLGVFYFKETFTQVEFVAFICIWTAILIFSSGSLVDARKKQHLQNVE